MAEGEQVLCDRNANCLFIRETNEYECQCKAGYNGTGQAGQCFGKISGFYYSAIVDSFL